MLSQRLIIIGTDGQARIAAAIARQNGYERIAFLDDDLREPPVPAFPVIGPVSDFRKYPEADFFIAYDDSARRQKTFTEFQRTDCRLVSLIHPSAIISPGASLDGGTLVLARCVIDANTSIGACCILNTCVSIAHDCQIGSFCQLSAGVHINEHCRIGANVSLGMKTTVTSGRTIAAGTVVPAESVIIRNITK